MEDLAESDLFDSRPGGDGGAPLSRAERRDQQVARILEAATSCFVRHGFQGASMQQICAECGMSPGAVYRYFPSKEAIIEAIAEADRRHDAVMFAVMADMPNVVEGVVVAGLAHIRHIHETGRAPLFAEIRAESKRNAAVQAACDGIMVEMAAMFRAYLEPAVRRGEIDPCVDLGALLPAIMAIGEGLSMSDLPSLGLPYDKLEIILRAMVTGLLRPTSATSSEYQT